MELIAQADTQRPQVQVEKSNFAPLTRSEGSTTVDLADSPLAQQMPAAEAATTDSTSTFEPIDPYSDEDGADAVMDQVTNVSQLRDVSPGDWAYLQLEDGLGLQKPKLKLMVPLPTKEMRLRFGTTPWLWRFETWGKKATHWVLFSGCRQEFVGMTLPAE